MRTITLAIHLIIAGRLIADDPKPPPLTPAEQKLAGEADKLTAEGGRLYQQGKPDEAAAKLRQVLEIHQKLYPASRFPGGHPVLAQSLNNLGFVLHAMGAPEKALPYYEQALAMRRRLNAESKLPGDYADLSQSLNNLGAALQATGAAEKALTFYEQALAINRRLYPVSKFPDGHPDLALSLNNLGFVLQGTGAPEKALTYFEQALAMRRRLYRESSFPNGHAEIAQSLNNLALALQEMGAVEKALSHIEQALDMRRRLYPVSEFPDGHPELARGLNNMGFALHESGASEKALPYLEQSLSMKRRLFPVTRYPIGHPELALSISNVGVVLEEMRASERALPYFEQALAMFRRLYSETDFPNGHPDLATALNNLGGVHESMGAAEKAVAYFEQALAMYRRLYPRSSYTAGHPSIAHTLNNLGQALLTMGAAEQALPHFEQALAIRLQLYPKPKYSDGHVDVVQSLTNLGSVLHSMGAADKALPLVKKALDMSRSLDRPKLRSASEADALEYLAAKPRIRDALLSLTLLLPSEDSAAYGSVWHGKSAVTRLLQQRRAAARAGGAAHAGKLDELLSKRRRIDQLLRDERLKPDDRDRLLTKLANERDALERELAVAIPLLKRAEELDALGPEALAQLVPDDSAFVDFVRYTRFEYENRKPRQTRSYAAFVVAKGRAIVRVELDEAGPIDAAVRRWREAIDARREAAEATTELKRRIWDRIVQRLPAGTKVLYFSPDGDLARLPWAALPIGRDRVLLEAFTLTQAPHGPFLLEQLKFGSKFEGSGPLLTLGGVAYGSKSWPALPSTIVETKAVAALAPGERYAISGIEATAAKLRELLPKARFAHLATHGEFQADALAAERKRADEFVYARRSGDDTRRVAAKNPLGYVGLALAGGDVISGLGIIDLPLHDLKLATLSACETGLGDYTGGEGVQGLQRAFHVAGCPNVVASLWKVSDAATAALMTKFYHELWANKRDPIEALRSAQLFIYHHPELIPDLSGERGAPKTKEALAVKVGEPGTSTTGVRNRADTKLWAAFVLSGLGR